MYAFLHTAIVNIYCMAWRIKYAFNIMFHNGCVWNAITVNMVVWPSNNCIYATALRKAIIVYLLYSSSFIRKYIHVQWTFIVSYENSCKILHIISFVTSLLKPRHFNYEFTGMTRAIYCVETNSMHGISITFFNRHIEIKLQGTKWNSPSLTNNYFQFLHPIFEPGLSSVMHTLRLYTATV